MMVFFMISGALRSAGDARTPMILGIVLTVLNLVLNIDLHPRPRPDSGVRHGRLGDRHRDRVADPSAVYALWKLWRGEVGGLVSARTAGCGPDWTIIRSLFRFGLPTGIQGIAMNVGGVFMLAFIGSLAQSAAAQAAFAVSYTQLFSLITWTSVGLMGAAATVAGQNLGAGQPERADQAVHIAARYGVAGAAIVGAVLSRSSRASCWRSSA